MSRLFFILLSCLCLKNGISQKLSKFRAFETQVFNNENSTKEVYRSNTLITIGLSKVCIYNNDKLTFSIYKDFPVSTDEKNNLRLFTYLAVDDFGKKCTILLSLPISEDLSSYFLSIEYTPALKYSLLYMLKYEDED